jgi:hypothetical protein
MRSTFLLLLPGRSRTPLGGRNLSQISRIHPSARHTGACKRSSDDWAQKIEEQRTGDCEAYSALHDIASEGIALRTDVPPVRN